MNISSFQLIVEHPPRDAAFQGAYRPNMTRGGWETQVRRRVVDLGVSLGATSHALTPMDRHLAEITNHIVD